MGLDVSGWGRGGRDVAYHPTLFHRLCNPPMVVEERYSEGGRDSAQLAPVWDSLGPSGARWSHYVSGNRKAESISR